MPALATDYIGEIPKYYDRYLRSLLFDAYAADLARRVRPGPGGAVLETAAGTGIASRHLRDALPADTRLVVTDLNEPMLAIARAKFKPGENVDFGQGDAQHLKFGEAAFDAVACGFSLMFFPDKPAAAREAARVLKPGGAFVFNVWDSYAQNELARITNDCLAGLYGPRRPPFYDTPFGYYRLDEIKALLAGAGFGRIEISVLPKIGQSPSAREATLGYVMGTPACLQIVERQDPPLETVLEAVEKAMRDALGSGVISAKMQAIVFEAYLG